MRSPGRRPRQKPCRFGTRPARAGRLHPPAQARWCAGCLAGKEKLPAVGRPRRRLESLPVCRAIRTSIDWLGRIWPCAYRSAHLAGGPCASTAIGCWTPTKIEGEPWAIVCAESAARPSAIHSASWRAGIGGQERNLLPIGRPVKVKWRCVWLAEKTRVRSLPSVGQCTVCCSRRLRTQMRVVHRATKLAHCIGPRLWSGRGSKLPGGFHQAKQCICCRLRDVGDAAA